MTWGGGGLSLLCLLHQMVGSNDPSEIMGDVETNLMLKNLYITFPFVQFGANFTTLVKSLMTSILGGVKHPVVFSPTVQTLDLLLVTSLQQDSLEGGACNESCCQIFGGVISKLHSPFGSCWWGYKGPGKEGRVKRVRLTTQASGATVQMYPHIGV